MRLRQGLWLGMSCLVMVAHSSAMAATNQAAVTVNWGYKGNISPEFWGQLNPQFRLCGEGKAQSPINIAKQDVDVKNTLQIHYRAEPLVLMRDGNTRLNFNGQQVVTNSGHGLQVDFDAKKSHETINYAGETYRLVQFHFHTPSENQLQGESMPLEIHFVHQSAKGHVLAIGVLVEAGDENAAIQEIIDHVPTVLHKDVVIKGETIKPDDLLPKARDYYAFSGSLTTPPCSEGLQWVVMADTITATPGQIAMMRKALGGVNARSVQPLNHRLISYSSGE